MKKRFLLILFLISVSSLAFGQTEESNFDLPPFVQSFLNTKYTFDEGVSYCQLTRIEKVPNASNYVRENMMFGAYFNAQTVDLSFIDLFSTFTVYYPFYQAFNGMAQKPRNMFNFAIDSITGITFTYERIKYVDINFSTGMHYMYQLTDEYYMHYIGLALILGLDFPITARWTIVNRDLFSYDNPNIGSNRKIQPFDGSYQYHFSFGVKYSQKVENKYSYIKQR